MASKTRYSVCRPRHSSQPKRTSVCVRKVGSVKTGARSCKRAAREGIICHMEGTSLSLGGCGKHRLLPRAYKESPPQFCPRNLRKFSIGTDRDPECTGRRIAMQLAMAESAQVVPFPAAQSERALG